MIGRALRAGAVLLVGVGLVAGCGSSNRPAELSMSEVKPCELISPATLRQLDVPNKPRPIDIVAGAGLEGRSCSFLPRAGGLVTISAITNEGIERWSDGSSEYFRFKDVRPIQEYPTIRTWNKVKRLTPNTTCTFYIDVADGESLRVQADPPLDDDAPPTCDTARQFAKAALETLLTNRT